MDDAAGVRAGARRRRLHRRHVLRRDGTIRTRPPRNPTSADDGDACEARELNAPREGALHPPQSIESAASRAADWCCRRGGWRAKRFVNVAAYLLISNEILI